MIPKEVQKLMDLQDKLYKYEQKIGVIMKTSFLQNLRDATITIASVAATVMFITITVIIVRNLWEKPEPAEYVFPDTIKYENITPEE